VVAASQPACIATEHAMIIQRAGAPPQPAGWVDAPLGALPLTEVPPACSFCLACELWLVPCLAGEWEAATTCVGNRRECSTMHSMTSRAKARLSVHAACFWCLLESLK